MSGLGWLEGFGGRLLLYDLEGVPQTLPLCSDTVELFFSMYFFLKSKEFSRQL